MTKGNNAFGAAGKHAIDGTALVKFFDAYTYEGTDPLTHRREKKINGRTIGPNHQRAVRRYRNGHTHGVNRKHGEELLAAFGFDVRWFEQWCKLHQIDSVA